MKRTLRSAAAVAALVLCAAAPAHAVTVGPTTGPGPVTATLDLGGPRLGGNNLFWQSSAFTSGFEISLGEGDTFDLTIDFLGDQSLTLNDPSYMWAFSYSGDPSADVRGTGRFAFLDENGDPILWSNAKTSTEMWVHFGQQFNQLDYDSLPSTLTFYGVRYVGTLEDYTESEPYGAEGWVPTYGEDEPFVRSYSSPALSLTGSSWFTTGVERGDFDGSSPTQPLLPNGGTADGGFVFTDVPVAPEEFVWFDPIVAVGYDFVLGPNSPNILWAIFPDLGDLDGYDVYSLADDWIASGVMGGALFDFTSNGYAGGIAGFRLKGIDPALGIDPNSPTAFVTGLAFAQGGTVVLTQTPITQNFDPGTPAVPEPATWATMVLGFGLLGAALRRRRSLSPAS